MYSEEGTTTTLVVVVCMTLSAFAPSPSRWHPVSRTALRYFTRL